MLNFVTGSGFAFGHFVIDANLLFLELFRGKLLLLIGGTYYSNISHSLEIDYQRPKLLVDNLIIKYSKRKDIFPTPIVVTYLKDYLALVSNVFSYYLS